MPRSLVSLFALYIQTPGRRIYALGRVRERALAKQLPELVAVVDAAIAHDRQTLELDAARLARSKSTSVREHDGEVDRTLVIIERLLSHYAKAPNPTASALLSNLFPVSLTQHIQLPFIEQAAANERVLELLEADSNAAWLDAHGLRPLIDQLRAAHDVFAAALHARDAETVPSWDDVRAMRERGQELYLQIVAQVIAQFIDKPEVRDELLEPIYTQDQLIKAYRRQRRTVYDIDPDSGELLELVGEGGGEGDEDSPPVAEPEAELGG